MDDGDVHRGDLSRCQQGRRERHAMKVGNALGLVALFVVASAGPAFAQSFLSGDWANFYHEDQPERGPGPALGDYLGIPINAAGRQYADSWDASRLTLPEHQ